jgi:hypothetical protein
MRIDGTDPFATAKPAARLIKLLIPGEVARESGMMPPANPI